MNNILLTAAQHALSQHLGYEEGVLYYQMLQGDFESVKQRHSHSKKYRLLKSLFEQSAIAKLRKKNKEIFSYVLLPPTFLYNEETEIEIIECLEELYKENVLLELQSHYAQIMLKNGEGLIYFLIKYSMKKKARLRGHYAFIRKQALPKKVEILETTLPRRSLGLIDEELAYDFTELKNPHGTEQIGYIARNPEDITFVSDQLLEQRTSAETH